MTTNSPVSEFCYQSTLKSIRPTVQLFKPQDRKKLLFVAWLHDLFLMTSVHILVLSRDITVDTTAACGANYKNWTVPVCLYETRNLSSGSSLPTFYPSQWWTILHHRPTNHSKISYPRDSTLPFTAQLTLTFQAPLMSGLSPILRHQCWVLNTHCSPPPSSDWRWHHSS